MAAPDRPVALSTVALVAGYERDLPIVRGVDFSVSQGELVVVLGPNGAGKSTFVKAIAGLVPIHSGTAVARRADITAVPAHEKIRHGLAFVPQTENIFATLSINDNLLLAADILPKDKRAPTHRRRSTRCSPISPRGRRCGPARSPAASGRCWRWRAR